MKIESNFSILISVLWKNVLFVPKKYKMKLLNVDFVVKMSVKIELILKLILRKFIWVLKMEI